MKRRRTAWNHFTGCFLPMKQAIFPSKGSLSPKGRPTKGCYGRLFGGAHLNPRCNFCRFPVVKKSCLCQDDPMEVDEGRQEAHLAGMSWDSF